MTGLRFPRDLEDSFREEHFRKSVVQARLAGLLALMITLGSGILDEWSPTPTHDQLHLFRYAIVAPLLAFGLAFTFSRYFRRFMQPAIAGAIILIGSALVDVTVVHLGDAHRGLLGMSLLVMYASTLSRLLFVPASLTAWGLSAGYVLAVWSSDGSPPELAANAVYLAAFNLFAMAASYFMETSQRRDFMHAHLLEKEQEESERLLLNILPKSIADRLKRDPRTIAERHAQVSVLFADLVDFTSLSAQLDPVAVVDLLNEVFSEFDRLAERHGLEKIKTIGDAYMVVAGLADQRLDHAAAVADMALDMRRVIDGFRGRPVSGLSLRVGIHSGPVVAGVIGTKKFSYDLWGDTVNTASRMESHGVANAIQVTETTYQLLRETHDLTPRGEIDVKGKGAIATYLLKDRRRAGTLRVHPAPTSAGALSDV